MVHTRSQNKNATPPSDEDSISPYQIQIIPNPRYRSVRTSKKRKSPFPNSYDETRRQDYYDMITDDQILSNKKYKKQLDPILDLLISEDPSLLQIINAKMSIRHKAELLEWFFIYENSMEMSDERRFLKKKIRALMNSYLRSYTDYFQHKDEIDHLEEINRDSNELLSLQLEILKLKTSSENKNIIYRKYLELQEKIEDMDDEFYKLKYWLKTAIQLPFDRILSFPDIDNITHLLLQVKHTLDTELYGMSNVKEQLLLFLHGKLRNPSIKGCCLGLVGPPGVGKTSIARCLSRILRYPFEQISLGGVHSVDFLRGFDYTYVGSRPGEIVRCLSRMKYKNGIIFFDEYDKISQFSDVSSCLLHLTDFTQNDQFRDHFLTDLTIDLSCIWFIYSMNNLPTDEALKDRIFLIEIEGYSSIEQTHILCHYLLPKHLQNLNLSPDAVQITSTVGQYIVHRCSEYAHEKGVRTIEKALKDLLNKLSFLVTNQQTIPCRFLPPSSFFPIHFPLCLTSELSNLLLQDFFHKSYSRSTHSTMYL